MSNKSKYSFLTYLFLFLTIIILFLFTKNIYYNLKENSQIIASLKEKVAQKQADYDNLSKIKLAIDSWKSDIKDFDKFLVKFNENEITKYFYDYANKNMWKLKIDSISLTDWKLNEFGFKEWKIDLVVSFSSEFEMIDMLNFILNSEEYNFYIHEFQYPFWNISWPFKVTIPLKVLYK
jgi:hypothetical protein